MPPLRTFIGLVVTVVWAIGYLTAVVNPKFQPSPLISPVMLVIVTWLFATEVRRKNGNGNGDKKDGD
jgi:hypothetical protein